MQTRSAPAVRDILSSLKMDETSVQYVLDIILTDDDATANASALYEAIGPFLVRKSPAFSSH